MLESITKMLTDPKESWWVVNGALMALKFAPANEIQTRLPLATSRYHTMPREWMLQHLNAALQQKKPASDAGKPILAALRKRVDTSEIKPSDRAPEGAHNVMATLKICLQNDPTLAVGPATALQPRFSE
jgi:hypothetical protein